MKTFLILSLFALALFGCGHQEREKAFKNLEHRKEKLSTHKQTVRSLNEDLAKLQQQWEVAEDNIIINLVKEFRIYRTKNEREQLIKNAVASKIDVEERIEKTILKINTQNDSVMHAEKKIIEVKATIND